jgi:hypothetical protein
MGGNNMHINEEKKRRIDLNFHEHNALYGVPRIVGKSNHDVTHLLKEQRIELARKYTLDSKQHMKHDKNHTKSDLESPHSKKMEPLI